MYLVGTAKMFSDREDFEQFDVLEDAERYAVTLSYNDEVISVSDVEDNDDDGEIVCLVFGQVIYRP